MTQAQPWSAWFNDVADATAIPTQAGIDTPTLDESDPGWYAPTVVCGVAGSAGTTTLASLVAYEVADFIPTVLIDTTAGGDLAHRSGADVPPAGSWQQWYRSGAEISELSASHASTLTRDAAMEEFRSPLADTVAAVSAQGALAILDVGAAVQAHLLTQVWPSAGAVLVACQDTAVQVNRLRHTLTALRKISPTLPGRAVIVLMQQQRGGVSLAPRLRDKLADKVADVLALPFDSHLATGRPIAPSALHEGAMTFGRNRIAVKHDVLRGSSARGLALDEAWHISRSVADDE